VSPTRHDVHAACLTIACAALAGLAPASASAATGCDRYASPSGSDAAAGSEASPFASAQKLADALSAGQTGCLRAGTYDPSAQYVLAFSHGGASGAPLTLRSYPGETARLVGIINIPNGKDFITLSRLKIEGDATQNTLKTYASDTTVEDNDITNLRKGYSCMMLGSNSGYGAAVRTIVRRNSFHDCGSPANDNKDHSIYAANSADGQIVDNLFVNQSGYTFQFYPNARRMVFAHNVIDGSGSVRGGVVFGGDTSYVSNNNSVQHNVITHAATYGITSSWENGVGSGNVASNNCLSDNRSGDVASQSGFSASANTHADPMFVNRAARDYRLSSSSPCLSVVGHDTAALIAAGPGSTPQPPSPGGDKTPPAVSWSTPRSGATVSGSLDETSAKCLVKASDNVGVTRVDFRLDGQPLNSELYAPWSCVWDTTKTPNGRHTLTPTARDAAGNSSKKSVTVTVSNRSSNARPTVALTSPKRAATFGSRLMAAASASDDNGVSRVEFYVDAKRVSTDAKAPYGTTWGSRRRISSGSHTVTAKAYDKQGLTATSSAVVTKS
jgi:hypothetical protein